MSQLRPRARVCPDLQEKARQAIDSAVFVPADAALEEIESCCADRSVIGLDTEFVRERTFYPRPGLIQIFDGERISLIDPIGRERNNALSRLMTDRAIIKVFHSVGEDLEIMQLVCGEVPQPLFDTQIAAAMLGFPLQYRYETLVEECFGATLAGGQARSDWCKRPLSSDLLHYAASDVAWLIELQGLLQDALETAGRLDWLAEDCQRLVDQAEAGDDRLPLLRVKGGGHLDEVGLAWLNRLSAWRERETRERDLPRSFVIKDDQLIQVAEKAARAQGRSALDALHSRERRRYGEALEALLNEPCPDPLARPPELQRLEPAQRGALKAAQARVRSLAERLEVDPALIASKRELTRLLFGERPEWASGWRQQFIPDILGS
jgi:ribonuclease D